MQNARLRGKMTRLPPFWSAATNGNKKYFFSVGIGRNQSDPVGLGRNTDKGEGDKRRERRRTSGAWWRIAARRRANRAVNGRSESMSKSTMLLSPPDRLLWRGQIFYAAHFTERSHNSVVLTAGAVGSVMASQSRSRQASRVVRISGLPGPSGPRGWATVAPSGPRYPLPLPFLTYLDIVQNAKMSMFASGSLFCGKGCGGLKFWRKVTIRGEALKE